MQFKCAKIVGKNKIIEAEYITTEGKKHRKSFNPSDDVSGEDQAIIDLATEYHTQAVKDQFNSDLNKFG